MTIYVNYPTIEAVITDEAGAYPSYYGTSTTAGSLVNGDDLSFTAIPLTGSDGESASITGFETTPTTGTAPALNVTVVGGIGFNGTVPQVTTATNTVLVGTYSGSFISNYSNTTTTTTEPVGTVSSFALTANTTSGAVGYVLNGSGTTFDPTGNAVNFSISNANVDPAGVISGLTITFTYANGTTPSVTNTYATGYLNLGVVATTTLTGLFQATTTTWPTTPVETDTFVLTQATAASKAKKKK